MQTPIISLEQVSVHRGDFTILSDVSLQIAPGAHCAVLGPNGAGKTTLVQIISGYLWPSTGRVSVLGQAFGQTDLHRLRRRVGLASQATVSQISPFMRARDVIYTGLQGTLALTEPPADAACTRAEQFVDQFGLSRVIDSQFGQLSVGERQRVLISRALMNSPDLLILDEPAAGMDMAGREKLLTHIEQLAQGPASPTLLMVTHHISEITPSFAVILMIKAGSVLTFGPKTSTLTERNVSHLYDLPVKLHCSAGRYWPQI
ncbi:MAG: ATP-binding cassette domain-containing protein [Actinobacteria bacterium]|nr:ATP-binding cassette domain-containing protein [Actinomycetota bacterium]